MFRAAWHFERQVAFGKFNRTVRTGVPFSMVGWYYSTVSRWNVAFDRNPGTGELVSVFVGVRDPHSLAPV